MQPSHYCRNRVVLSFLFTLLTTLLSAQSVSILYTFTGGQDGASPTSPLLLTHAGSLLGAAQGEARMGMAPYFS